MQDRPNLVVVLGDSRAILSGMSGHGKTALFVLLLILFCAASKGAVADSANPYQGIVDRNVFGLKPPPPPAKPEEKKVDAPKITLTGITTILGNKRVLMNVAMPPKPPEPAKQQSLILAEGQREGEIEVMEIDEKAGSVKVNDYGTILTLNLDKDGAKLPAAVPAAPPPAAPPAVGYTPPPPVIQPNPAAAAGNPLGGLKTIPSRTVRMPAPGGVPVPSGPPIPGPVNSRVGLPPATR